MAVVTVYCCGTRFHQDSTDIIAETYKSTAAQAPTETITGRKWINDGPGNVQHPIPKVKEFVTGRQVPKVVQALGGLVGRKTTPYPKTIEQYSSGAVGSALRGGAFGTGWADNVVRAVQWLGFVHNEDPITHVNIAGWSRGAVTCTMIAHELLHCPGLHFPIHIFAFDPVPGGEGDFKSKGMFGSPQNLPANVTTYTAILMENVSKWFFSCVGNVQGTGIPDGRNVISYPLPGSHAECVRISNPGGKIAAHLFHTWLTQHGTLLRTHHGLAAPQLIELYSELVIKTHPHKPSKQRGPLIHNPVRGRKYYVNLHHHELFHRFLPDWAAVIDRGAPSTTSAAGALKGAYPKTHEALVKTGYIKP